MDRRVAPALVAVALALVAALLPHREEPAIQTAMQADGTLFFSMLIADAEGEVIAEPMLLGMCGVPLEMTLADPGRLDEPRMSLRLESALGSDGRYQIDYELEVPGLAAHGRGTVRMRAGEEKLARVEYPGGHLEVQLAAFAVPSPEFHLFLRHANPFESRGS